MCQIVDMEINAYMMKMEKEFREKFGLEFVSVSEGRAVATFNIGPEHRNPLGFVYGGIIYNLADIVAGVAFFTTGAMGPTVEGSMKYLSGSEDAKTLTLEGNVIKSGRNLGFVEVKVKDERGNLVETGSFTYFNMGSRG